MVLHTQEAMTMTMTPRDGTERIRCPPCHSLVPVRTGPEHWLPAHDGVIEPFEALTCPGCGTQITEVDLGSLVTVPMRLKQLRSWGAVLCFKHEPTHEDLDQVEELFASKSAEQAS